MTPAQLTEANFLGQSAFKRGVQCAPALDRKFMDYLARIKPTNAVVGWAVPLMEAWHTGWSEADVRNPTLKCGEGAVLRACASSYRF